MTDKGLAGNYRGADVEEISMPQLYDMDADMGETKDVAEAHPEIVRQLLKTADEAREDIGDYDRIGRGARFYDKAEKRPDVKRWSQH